METLYIYLAKIAFFVSLFGYIIHENFLSLQAE